MPGFRLQFLLYLISIATFCLPIEDANARDYRRYIVIGGAPQLSPFGVQPPTIGGVFEIYSFEPDGSYRLWRDNEGGSSRDKGTYSVSGNRVFLTGRQGRIQGVISPDRRSVNIGGNVYEAAGTSPPAPPIQRRSCTSSCDETYNECNIGGRPYNYCSSQYETCLSRCR
jgi:hypothetical protein